MSYKQLVTMFFLFASISIEAQNPQLFHLKNSKELVEQTSAAKDTQYHLMRFQTDYSPTSWAEFSHTNSPFRLSTGNGFEIYTDSVFRMSIDSTGKFRFAGLTLDNTKTRFLVTDSLGNLFYRNLTLAGLTDINISSPANNDVLQYQTSDNKWHNEPLSSTAVTSVTNSDGTLTVSPTTGSVIASLALAHANTWTGIQTHKFNSLGVSPADAIVISNTTAATSGAQQMSPSIHWIGQGWKTTSTAGSQTVDFYANLLPVQFTTNPAATWQLNAATNGGTINNVLGVNYNPISGGSLTFNDNFTGELQYSNNSNQPSLSLFRTGSSGPENIIMGSPGVEAEIIANNSPGLLTILAPATWGIVFEANAGEAARITQNRNLLINSTTDQNSSYKFQLTGLAWMSGTPTSSGTPTVLVKGSDSLIKQISLANLATSMLSTGTVASADLTGQTGTVASVATFTPSANGTFRIGSYASITAISSATLTVTVTWTDETSTSRILTFYPMGQTTAGLTATGETSFPLADIRAKSANAITVVSTFSGTSITYDIGATITQLR